MIKKFNNDSLREMRRRQIRRRFEMNESNNVLRKRISRRHSIKENLLPDVVSSAARKLYVKYRINFDDEKYDYDGLIDEAKEYIDWAMQESDLDYHEYYDVFIYNKTFDGEDKINVGLVLLHKVDADDFNKNWRKWIGFASPEIDGIPVDFYALAKDDPVEDPIKAWDSYFKTGIDTAERYDTNFADYY